MVLPIDNDCVILADQTRDRSQIGLETGRENEGALFADVFSQAMLQLEM